MQQIKAWFTLLPSNPSLVIKRAEQPQTLVLGVILTRISPISLRAIADVTLH